MYDQLARLVASNNFEELEKSIFASTCTSSFQRAEYRIPTDEILDLPSNNLTLLHIAALMNSTQCFYSLLKIIDIDARSAQGYTPFHYAVLGNSVEIALFIIAEYKNYSKNHDDISVLFEDDYEDRNKKKLPFLAARASSPLCMQALFDNGYSFDKYKSSAKKSISDTFLRCITQKSTQCLEIILKYTNPTRLEYLTQDGYTPIMIAVIHNNLNALEILLKTSQDATVMTNDNKTALYFACFLKCVGAVKLLCDNMIKVDIPASVKSAAAVHWACQSHSADIIEMIVKKDIDVNRLDEYGRTGPYHLIDSQESELLRGIQALYDAGFQINLHSPKQNTILGDVLTTINKNYTVIEWLLEHGADPNIPLRRGRMQSDQETIGDAMRTSASTDRRMACIVHKYLDY